MHRNVRFALSACALSLCACQPDRSGGTERNEGTAEAAIPGASRPAQETSPAPSPSPLQEPTGANPTKANPFAGENDGYPDLTPAPVTAEARRTAKGAMAIALPFARGIELREFDQSWNLLGPDAKASWSKDAFNAKFASLANHFVAFGDGRMEGAAGSTFYTLPLTVTGATRDGTERTSRGELVLRRTNEVPGATDEQLAWQIVSLKLD